MNGSIQLAVSFMLLVAFSVYSPDQYEKHKTLVAIKGRVILVGDVHGCLEELQALLHKCRFNQEKDTVILTGDLVNKGPYSVQVVQYLRKIEALSVIGNHDIIALNAYYHPETIDKYPEYDLSFVNDFDEADIKWLSLLPYTISISPLKSVVVHAGLVPGVRLHDQSDRDMVLMRNVVLFREKCLKGSPLKWHATTNTSVGQPWASVYYGKPKVYYGHDAPRGLQKYTWAMGIDTGCVNGKQLTAVILPEGKIVSVDAKKQYWKMTSPPEEQ